MMTNDGLPAGRLKPAHLAHILGVMVDKNLAAYEPPTQTRAALLYWRLPEEWAEVLHEWVSILHPQDLSVDSCAKF
jgi:hypothetical protein